MFSMCTYLPFKEVLVERSEKRIRCVMTRRLMNIMMMAEIDIIGPSCDRVKVLKGF
jgi:hypothetical protein